MILVDTSVWIDHFRRDIGLVDLHLFASTLLTPGTRRQRLPVTGLPHIPASDYPVPYGSEEKWIILPRA